MTADGAVTNTPPLLGPGAPATATGRRMTAVTHDKATVGGDEVLVRVRAASAGRGTWHLTHPIRREVRYGKERSMSTHTKVSAGAAYDSTSRRAAVTAGVLFLTATATFLAGDVLIAGAFTTATAPAAGPLAAGVALQALCAIASAGIGLALLDVLGRHSRTIGWGYLAVRCAEAAAIIAIGAYVLATRSKVANYEIMIYGFTGTAGLMLSYVLHRARLVPAWLSWLGILGYVAIAASIPVTLMDIATLDAGVGMLLYLPGALFELLLPILLIARGFRRPQTAARRSMAEAELAAA